MPEVVLAGRDLNEVLGIRTLRYLALLRYARQEIADRLLRRYIGF